MQSVKILKIWKQTVGSLIPDSEASVKLFIDEECDRVQADLELHCWPYAWYNQICLNNLLVCLQVEVTNRQIIELNVDDKSSPLNSSTESR